MTSGDTWWTETCEKIEKCDCFVLILTGAYIESFYFLAELTYAQLLSKPILPIMLDQSVKLSPKVMRFQTLQVFDQDTQKAFRETSARLSSLPRLPAASPDRRPPEPVPIGKAQVSAAFADAVKTEAVGNLGLATYFYKQISQSDYDLFAYQASDKLKAISQRYSCADEYEKIVILASHPETLNTAVDLWQTYRESHCFGIHDPHNFTHDPRFFRPASIYSPKGTSTKLVAVQKPEKPTRYGPDWFLLLISIIAIGMILLTILATRPLWVAFRH
jgi:TIR domain